MFGYPGLPTITTSCNAGEHKMLYTTRRKMDIQLRKSVSHIAHRLHCLHFQLILKFLKSKSIFEIIKEVKCLLIVKPSPVNASCHIYAEQT